jgi:ssDNA-binding replication factor A large subunit
MYKTKSELYEAVSDIISQNEFEKRVKSLVDEYEGLLNEDAVSYLIVDELGRNVVRCPSISDLKHGDSVSLDVVVEEIGNIREFNKKDGGKGTVANITISDGKGTCRFTLWNKDVEVLTNNKIKVGSKIKIVNGYVKVSNFGTEISVGRWGMFTILNHD